MSLLKTVKCYTCGDTGSTAQNPNFCPACGRKANTKYADTDIVAEELFQLSDYIPQEYKNEKFDVNRLRVDHMDLKDNQGFKFYADSLEKVSSRIQNGELLPKSMLIYAPQGFSKNHFVYSCLVNAIESGLTAIPYMDTLEIKRFVDSYEQNHLKDDMIRYYKHLTDMKIYTADLCIVKIPVGLKYVEAYQTMLMLLDRRSRKGKTTVFISRYPLKTLVAMDMNKELISLFNKDIKTKNMIYIPYKSVENK